MIRTVLGGAVLAVFAGLLAVGGDAIGITTVWPVLLAAAVGIAAAGGAAGRVGGLLAGAVVGFVAMALLAGFLAQTAASNALVVVLAVVVLTLLAALTRGAVPLWSGLAGYVAFVGLYEPIYEAAPTAFMTDAPVALGTIIVATGVGALAAMLAQAGASAVSSADPLAVKSTAGTPAAAGASEEVV